MESFRDKDGREWQIDLTIGNVEHVKKSTAFNLYAPDEPLGLFLHPDGRLDLGLAGDLAPDAPSLQQLLWTDTSALFQPLWALVEGQAKEAGTRPLLRPADRRQTPGPSAVGLLPVSGRIFPPTQEIGDTPDVEEDGQPPGEGPQPGGGRVEGSAAFGDGTQGRPGDGDGLRGRGFATALADGHGKLEALSASTPAA